jgi:hypothetical protein
VIRSSIFSSLILSLVLVAGCEKDPPQTTPPGDGQTASTDGDGNGKKPKKGPKGEGDKQPDGPSADENDPTKKVCPAETADFPEAYFEMTVLIRLPKGVTADNFVEMQPGLATLSGDVESVSCIPDMPGAMITHMVLASFPEDAAKDITVWRDEIVEAFGYAGATYSEEKIDAAKRHYQGAVELPAANGAEPAKALVTIVSANGFMYALAMETHPDAWNALKETFYTVASKMSFRKA